MISYEEEEQEIKKDSDVFKRLKEIAEERGVELPPAPKSAKPKISKKAKQQPKKKPKGRK